MLNQSIKNFLFLVFASALLAGCAGQARYYFHNGDPLPSSEISYVIVHSTMKLINFDTIPLRRSHVTRTFDVLPGKHALGLSYSFSRKEASGVRVTSKGNLSALELNAKPGHIYYVYPSFPSRTEWVPAVVDFADMDELSNPSPAVLDKIPVPDEHKMSLVAGLKKNAEEHFKRRVYYSFRVSKDNYWE